jgi:Xaa-Pro aminopeptidase
MPDVLIHAATLDCAEMRHEIPATVVDPFLYGERDGAAFAVLSVLDEASVRAVRPDVEILDPLSLGLTELLDQGLDRDAAQAEVLVRACEHVQLRSAVVPRRFPLAVADRLRAAGVELTVDGSFFDDRRRVKAGAELQGIRRAALAAEAGMATAARLLAGAAPGEDGILRVDGTPLTAERIQLEIRAAFDRHGAAGDEILVAPGPQGATGHDLGSGPVAAGVPVVVDLWPRDRASGCWADMTRTFVAGEPADDVVGWHNLCRDALARVLDAVAPGVTGRELWEVCCDVFEAAGEPTQRDPQGHTPLRDGFFHSLGHGVGLEVHEAPSLGRSGEPLVAGDVLAIEPGLYRHGYGGVRLEDLVLVTEDGWEPLTSFSLELRPDVARDTTA